ncbi:MAG: formylglycine-generating enzyme family protein [Verrucomicrobiales bacterium]|nr:formylglycine-generating enzyme family protein [Verrucomicrobiales bacterium]
MKNLPSSRKLRTSFAIAFCCLSIVLIGACPTQQGLTETLPGGVKLEMVAIPGGAFMMGSKTYLTDAQPIHRVTLKPFSIGKYEVTQAQWKAIMGNNPSYFKGDTLPVEQVSWEDTREFCQKLSKMTGKEYRLPTEAEWEYAAKAGSSGDYCFGDDASLLGDYAWYSENSMGKGTRPVGQLKPNVWGLFDMHGNVLEWCEDIWHNNYEGAPTDGAAWVTGGNEIARVLRGGAFTNSRIGVRAVSRSSGETLDRREGDVGFRVVCSTRPPSQ